MATQYQSKMTYQSVAPKVAPTSSTYSPTNSSMMPRLTNVGVGTNAPIIYTKPTSTVLGASTAYKTPTNANMTSAKTGLPAVGYISGTSPAPAPSTGGGGNGGGGGGGGGGGNGLTPQEAFFQSYPNTDFSAYASQFNNDPSAFFASINDQYNQQEQALAQQESALRAAQESFGKTVEADYATGLSRASGSKQKAESSLQQNTVAAEQRKQDALNAARKLYQEMQMGFRQRFGGATSAGEAAQAILGTEQQRQAGSIGRDYQNTVGQIQAQKVDLENNYQTMIQDLAGQKQRALAELQNNFMNSLNQINSNRTQSIAAREEAKRGVLMQMRNEAFAIAQQAQANQQQLQAMKLQAQIQLDSQLKLISANAAKGNSLVDQFSGRNSTIGTNLTPAGTTATTNISTAPQNALSSAVGQMSSAPVPIATTVDGRIRYSDGSIR